MKTPAAIYARYSSDAQDARSIEDQERRCRRYAEAHDFEVVEVFSDAAISGATLDRPGLRRMLDAARQGAFKVVLVDDLSRLSRDLYDTLGLQRKLASAGAAFLDCSSGVSSRDKSSRVLTVVQGLINERYLDDLRDKTHRGLEGRARGGFWAGGRCYGYDTSDEENPPDPEHVRRVPVIDQREAEVVRRIFEECAAGATTRQVADGLNRDRIAAPYDPRPRSGDRGTLAYQKSAGRGWGCGTIRSILRNERYIGTFTWNRRRWVLDPETRRHRAEVRPRAEWVTVERPDLAIVGQALWRRAQQRLGLARPLGAPRKRMGYRTSPLSGLLRCGACGAGMQIAGRGYGGKEKYRNFKCAANHSKGDTVCASRATISESKVLGALVAALRELVEQPRYLQPVLDHFSKTFARLLSEQMRARAAPPPDAAALDREIRQARAEAQKVAGTLLAVGVSDTLRERLAEVEARVRGLEARRAALRAPAPPRKGPPLPSAEQLRAALLGVAEALGAAGSDQANRALRASFEPVVLTPSAEEWAMRTALRLDPAALVGAAGSYALGSCGGRI